MPEPGLNATKPVNADNWMSNVEGLPPVRSDDPTKALALTGIRAATHEGFTRVVIGAPAPRQFQIGFLSNPVRMVIDIRD